LLGYVNGNRVRPTEGVESQDEWDMVDSQVMTLISNSLELQLSETFYCETTLKIKNVASNRKPIQQQKQSLTDLSTQKRNQSNPARN
jgi:hypothetical protein